MNKRYLLKVRSAYNGADSTAPDFLCQTFDISQRKTSAIANKTDYTSHGKRKATAGDPIREASEIMAAKQYFLTHGKSERIRLRNHMIFVLGISIGVRGCDLLNLRIRDVLNPNGSIKEHIVLYERKTGKHNDPCLNSSSQEAILMYLDSLQGNFSMDDYLICSERGSKMDESQLYRVINQLQTKLGLPYHMSAHSLRKTFAYWNIKLHPNDTKALITLQGMLNHDSPATTLRYCGITKDDEDVFYRDIDKLFS